LSNTGTIRIGTRKSRLAIWQADHVAQLLQKQGIPTELKPIDTKGDKILDVSISKIGSKGVFTEEIENELLSNSIDIAVHSAKDLQSNLPLPFEILAFTEREQAFDVLVSYQNKLELNEEIPLSIGTSSTRRVAILKKYFPQVHASDIRGNLQTRLKKLEESNLDGLILAYAGVKRMGFENLVKQKLNTKTFTPPAGQGTIALEILKSMPEEKKAKIKIAVNHLETERAVRAERSFLRVMNGGCSIPVFCHAQISGDKIKIHGGISTLDGRKEVRHTLEDNVENYITLGETLGNKVLLSGGDSILREIKQHINN
jgi:hydroxymethylbilane synthase